VFAGIAIPDKILTVPIIAAFTVSFLHFLTLYRLRVNIPARHLVGAVFAAMAVQWTVARAVSFGLVRDHLPFVRTAKGGASQRQEFPAFWEAILASLLLISSVLLIATNRNEVREITIFAAALVLQSLPFLAATAIAALDGSRFNEIAYWKAWEARLADVLPGRVAKAPAAAVDKRADTAP